MLEIVLAADVMGIVWAVVVGGVIGWLASIVMKTNAQMGLLANVVVGIIGSVLGHWLAGKLGVGAGSTLGSLLVSLCGAILLIVLLRALKILR